MPKPSKLSPLWIISLFVTFTEAVLGYAVTKTDAWVQGTLTCFVIVFALGVAWAFFYILWHKPHHFYSPSDFGSMSPSDFVGAMRGAPTVTIEQAKQVANNPEDKNALYQLLDNILDNTFKQHLILMAEQSIMIPYVVFLGHVYEHGKRKYGWSNGLFQPQKFINKLEGTGFVDLIQKAGPKLKITDKGRAFAEWLVENGKKDDFFASDLGGWGTPFKPGDDIQEPQKK